MDADTLTLDTVVGLSPDRLSANVDGEVVLLNTGTSQYSVIGGTGGAIMECLATPQSLRNVCAQLVHRFDVAPDTCEREVLAFVRELIGRGLAVVRA